MASISGFFSRLTSRTFLAGLISGLVLGGGGFYLYAQVRVQMGGGDPPEQPLYLDPIEVADSTGRTVRGTVPDDWSLRSLDGTDATTFGALAERPTLLAVGATWCEPCTAQMPSLQALHDTTGQALRVVLVSPEPRDSLRRHVETKGYTLPAYTVDDLPGPLRGDVLPRTYLTRSGETVVYRHVGPADWNTDAVHRLLDRVRSSTPDGRADATARQTGV